MKKMFITVLLCLLSTFSFAHITDTQIPWRLNENNNYSLIIDSSNLVSFTVIFQVNEMTGQYISDSVFVECPMSSGRTGYTTLNAGSSTVCKITRGKELTATVQRGSRRHGSSGNYIIIPDQPQR